MKTQTTLVRTETDGVRTETNARRKWVGIIFALLALQMSLTAVGVTYALRGGKSAAIEDDYYNKALHWDDHAALVRASAQLGWKTELTVGSTATTGGQRALMIHLTDASGAPLEGARVDVACFHHARPMELTQVELKSTGGGLYAGSVPLDRQGIWEFRLTIHRGGGGDGKPAEVFIQTLQRDLLE